MRTLFGVFLLLSGFLSWDLIDVAFLSEYMDLLHFIQVLMIFGGIKLVLQDVKPDTVSDRKTTASTDISVNNLTYRTEVLRTAHQGRTKHNNPLRDSSRKAA